MSGFRNRCWAILAMGILPAWASPLRPDAKEVVETALHKLAASENFSWVAMMIEETDGKDPKLAETMEGKSIRGWCRIARPKSKKTDEAFLKNDRLALLTPEGWRMLDARGAAPGGEKPDKNVKRAQEFVAAKAPIAEAKLLLGRMSELALQENGLYAGRLAPKDVPLILERMASVGKKLPTFDPPPTMRVNFRIKDGVLASYELVVTGAIVKGKKNPTVEQRLVSVAVDFNDVGTTTLEIPDEARKLLE